ncbi:hypothetical protein JCM33374_g1983 [Metschnikowia sp. JCM 33374]|nr:hypothetical protein JCM33374_g1983 [Metschnikowia sp. JCM 33374]
MKGPSVGIEASSTASRSSSRETVGVSSRGSKVFVDIRESAVLGKSKRFQCLASSLKLKQWTNSRLPVRFYRPSMRGEKDAMNGNSN